LLLPDFGLSSRPQMYGFINIRRQDNREPLLGRHDVAKTVPA